jgi:hypothetical protein
MRKIGIITVFTNFNYGSKLQSFALQQTLKSLGFKGENILIQETSIIKKNKLISIIKKPELIIRFASRKKYRNRENLFNEYTKNNLNVSSYNNEQIKDLEMQGSGSYFKYICGSDQIWAPNQFNENFFLSFINKKENKIAYAPSIGLPVIPTELINKYTELISDFEYISVREKDGAKIIKELTGRDAPVVLDPTLLLTGEDWKKHMVQPNKKSPYILCYFLGWNKGHREWVEDLKRKTGYRIIVLPFATRDFFWGDEQAFEVGPKEFIGLINNAEIICTDSYHGILFSTNLNKEFYAFLRFKDNDELNQNSRVKNILETLNLENRIVKENQQDLPVDINWNSVNEIINKNRYESINYLKNAIEIKEGKN